MLTDSQRYLGCILALDVLRRYRDGAILDGDDELSVRELADRGHLRTHRIGSLDGCCLVVDITMSGLSMIGSLESRLMQLEGHDGSGKALYTT